MSKILIVFAQKGEAQRTIERFNASPVNGEMTHVWSEGLVPSLYAFDYGWIALSSVGVIAAQMTVAKYAQKSEEIWNLGLAGRLRGESPIGKLISVQKVGKFIPIFSKDIDSRSFVTMQGIHPPLSLEGESHLVSSDFPVHEHAHRMHLAENYDLVDMEGYGIAYAANALGKKCRMWKIISDFASPGGRELIQKNKDLLSKQLADHIESELCQKK